MEFFSTRNKILSINPNGLRSTSIQLRERIWNVFYKEEYDYYDTLEYTSYTTGIEDMMLEMGIKYEFPANKIYKNQNAEKLHKHVVQCEGMWYRIYDFIEKYLRVTDSEKTQRLTIEFNRILEEEVAPYRILNGLVVPIIGKSELNSISETIDLEYESVSKHMTKALELYSDRKKPDYENSVKESISSVESMCSIITGLSGGAATLGKIDKDHNANAKMKNMDFSRYPFNTDDEYHFYIENYGNEVVDLEMFVEVFKKIDYNLNCIAGYYEEMATFVPDYD